METVESVILAPSTEPVVRDRLRDVLAAAAFTFHGPGKEGFQSTWKCVRPPGKPIYGIPFDMDDPMFNRTLAPDQGGRNRDHRDGNLSHPPRRRDQDFTPSEEDMQRLFGECDIALRRTRLLKDALTNAVPDSLHSNPIIKA